MRRTGTTVCVGRQAAFVNKGRLCYGTISKKHVGKALILMNPPKLLRISEGTWTCSLTTDPLAACRVLHELGGGPTAPEESLPAFPFIVCQRSSDSFDIVVYQKCGNTLRKPPDNASKRCCRSNHASRHCRIDQRLSSESPYGKTRFNGIAVSSSQACSVQPVTLIPGPTPMIL